MSLDIKKKEMEMKRVILAKEELELKIEVQLDEVERLKEHIKIQETTAQRLFNEIQILKNK